MRTLSAALFALLLGGVHAKAENTVKQYRAYLASPDQAVVNGIKIYVQGLAEGIQAASVATQKQLYCPPKGVPLAMNNYVDILDRQIRKAAISMPQAQLESTWVVVLLLEGLQQTFPCGPDKSQQ